MNPKHLLSRDQNKRSPLARGNQIFKLAIAQLRLGDRLATVIILTWAKAFLNDHRYEISAYSNVIFRLPVFSHSEKKWCQPPLDNQFLSRENVATTRLSNRNNVLFAFWCVFRAERFYWFSRGASLVWSLHKATGTTCLSWRAPLPAKLTNPVNIATSFAEDVAQISDFLLFDSNGVLGQ